MGLRSFRAVELGSPAVAVVIALAVGIGAAVVAGLVGGLTVAAMAAPPLVLVWVWRAWRGRGRPA